MRHRQCSAFSRCDESVAAQVGPELGQLTLGFVEPLLECVGTLLFLIGTAFFLVGAALSVFQFRFQVGRESQKLPLVPKRTQPPTRSISRSSSKNHHRRVWLH